KLNCNAIRNTFSSKKSTIGLISGPLSFFIILLSSLFLQSQLFENNQGHDSVTLFTTAAPFIALATMAWMLVWWVTECVPMGFTGLLAPFIFILFGILTPEQALSKFSDPIIWIFISGFILAAAFKKSRLDERIAYKLGTLYKGNNPKIAIFFVACLPVFVLSMTGSITASTTIVFPLVMAFLKVSHVPFNSENSNKDRNQSLNPNSSKGINRKNHSMNEKTHKKSNYEEASFLSLGQAATAGAMLLLISTAPNLIAKSTVEDFVPGESISFTDWFIVGAPHAILGLLISWNIIFLFIKPEFKSISSSTSQFKEKLKGLGKITREEKAVLVILFSALILWVVPSVLRSFYPSSSDTSESIDNISLLIGKIANSIPISIPALLIILSIGLVKLKYSNLNEGERLKKEISGIKDEEKIKQTKASVIRPILTWEEMLKAIDWNIIFLFGGGLVLGLGIENSGLASIISNEISIIAGSHLTELSLFALSAILGFILSYAASNTASAVIACPIAASLAIGAGINPIPPIIAAALGASISSAIPSATPPMAIVYSSKAISILNMFKTGMMSDLLRLVLLILLGPPLIQLIY
ncbi:MAG: anion permease, partial [Candidatus Nitrosocosmicus sp.]|nr:anion permease [Candidatus Nitrosocosmicus sp.]